MAESGEGRSQGTPAAGIEALAAAAGEAGMVKKMETTMITTMAMKGTRVAMAAVAVAVVVPR